MDSEVCAERHLDIKSKLPSKHFYWIMVFVISSLSGSYAYTHSVEAKVYENEKNIQQVVTKADMEKYQDAMIEAIKGLK